MESAAASLTSDTQVFRDVFNASPIGIAVENLDGQPLFVNPAFCDFLGFSEIELRGKHCVDFSPPEDAEKDWAFFQQLRAGLIDHYQLEKRYFRRDGSLIWGNLSVSLLKSQPSPLVLAMVENVTVKKIAEEALQQLNRTLEQQTALLQSQEELLKIFVKNVPAGVAMLDRDLRYVQVSDRFCADYLIDPASALGRSHYEVFSDVPERWKEIHRRALEGATVAADEDPWVREGGTTWVRWEVRPWRRADGSIGGILIFAEDITRRKHMEEALSSLSRKLIASQEQERTRIGRELHDDISQRLALVAIDLERMQNNPAELPRRLQEAREQMIAISSDVQALSHELHASKLEYLGVVSGMKSWCREFGGRQKMEIDFRSDVSTRLPFEIGLTLFRVLQEALHNAAKHSGVKRVDVQVMEQSQEVHLIVSDAGSGFDLKAAKESGGLGLTSMQERLQLVHGEMAIESKPASGTSIHVRVPVKPADPV